MAPARPAEVLIVSLASTAGLRRADEQLRSAIERAGASCAIAPAPAPEQVRTLALTDLRWARAARTGAQRALSELGSPGPRAIIYSSTTAALLWPRRGAIRFDAPSAGNRPGRHGLWQRPLERRRLAHAPLLLPWSEGGLLEAPAAARRGGRTLIVPVPVGPSAPPAPARDIAAITYAANPAKKGLERVLAAWRSARAERPWAESEELLVTGASGAELARAGIDLQREPGVRTVGALAQSEYRGLLRRARVFLCAPRREDYGIAQLEALADGCLLASTPAPGPYAALPIARDLDARLIDEDLARALRTALDDPRPDYARRAALALAPFAGEAVDRLVAEQLLPRLLA